MNGLLLIIQLFTYVINDKHLEYYRIIYLNKIYKLEM
jgi:hypothetical protein